MSPGVQNLFVLLEALAPQAVVDKLKGDYERGELRYVELKDAVAEAMIAELTPIRERRAELLADREKIVEILADGAAKSARDRKGDVAGSQGEDGVSPVGGGEDSR